MTYPQAIRYLASFINFEHTGCWSYQRSFKLERFRYVLSLMGNPHTAFPSVHVAGSKGKGSTCAFIASILREAGFTVGLYTSPHLVDLRERIRILRPGLTGRQGKDVGFEGIIPRHALAREIQQLRPSVGRADKVSRSGPLTFFEAFTAIAFSYFRSMAIDIAVLETGLGGRLDATNVVSPLVSVITPVSLEHTEILGVTLAAIAREKAGIIKKGAKAVVSAPQLRPARAVIRHRCAHMHVPLYEIGKDAVLTKTPAGLRIRGRLDIYERLRPRLIGEHQAQNAATAVLAVEALSSNGLRIGRGAIRVGVNRCTWPGRCETIGRSPLVIIDAAHTPVSARALASTVRQAFRYRRLILVIGISVDKDIEGICRILKPIADCVITTRSDNPRAVDPLDLSRYFWGKELYVTYRVSEALRLARGIATVGDAILATGSVFVIGEFRDAHKRLQ